MSTKAEKIHMDKVAQIGCIVCMNESNPDVPACLHHATGIRYRATGKKAANFNVLPLCYDHHQGRNGIHTIGMRIWEEQYGTQETLLNQVNELIS